MIEIIERGTKQIKKCKACGCVFSFEKLDIKHTPVKSIIICPQCEKEITLVASK